MTLAMTEALLWILCSAASVTILGLIYIWVRYTPIIVRIFVETPVFAPLRAPRETGGEDVRFLTADGRELAGTYLRGYTHGRTGVIVFCPEYLGDRWSFSPYCEGLREQGFDLFTFDFRNHGDSQDDSSYEPLQWVSDREVVDLKAALAYLATRPDRDPAGVALYGISRGAGTALCVAAEEPTVWAVATDGAFPTRGTMLAYVIRWATIPIRRKWVVELMPRFLFVFAAWAGRVTAQYLRNRTYPNLERAVRRLAPRPWLMIHGQRDVYIGPEIAMELFRQAREPKTAWIVPGAKHNRCRDANPNLYRDRVVAFFRDNAPRRTRPNPDSRVSSSRGRGNAGLPALPVGETAKYPAAAAFVAPQFAVE